MNDLTIGNPAAFWAALLFVPIWIGTTHRQGQARRALIRSAIVRCACVAFGILALADLQLTRELTVTVKSHVYLLVDRSNSMADETDAASPIEQLKSAIPSDRTVRSVYFAATSWTDGQPAGDRSQTDIAGAIDTLDIDRVAAESTDVVLVTDGRSTKGDAVSAAARMAARGVRVHVVPVGPDATELPRVVGVEPPIQTHPGSPAPIRVTLRGAATQPVVVSLIAPDGRVVDQRSISLHGESTTLLRDVPTEPGIANYTISTQVTGGGPPTTRPVSFDVETPPRVLVVDRSPSEASQFVAALGGLKMPLDVATPDRLPSDLSPYAAIVLSDLVGDEFSPEQRLAVKTFVEDRGSGLVFIGGSGVMASRWKDNPLADLLPVRMKERPAKVVAKPPDVSICFVIDSSGSMAGVLPGQRTINKLELVKQSVLDSLGALPQNARVSVIAFDSTATLVVDAASVANRDAIAKVIDTIGIGGGTTMYPAIATGLSHLANADGDRFLIVLTDGQSDAPGPGNDWADLTTRARSRGIMWTSIAVGSDSDQQLLESLAIRAGGGYRYCETSDDVPRVFVDQANAVRRLTETKQPPFTPRPGRESADLRYLGTDVVPQLTGAVPAETRGGARQQLFGEGENALLASWQAGAGRVVAFTGDVKNAWASDWQRWDRFADFWDGQIRSVAFSPPPLRVRLTTRHTTDTARFKFEVTDEGGKPADRLECSMTAADGAPINATWRQTAPGVYTADLLRSADSTFRFVLTRPDRRAVHYVTSLAGPSTANEELAGPDYEHCRAIADAGGGIMSTTYETLLNSTSRIPAQHHYRKIEQLWPYALLVLLVLWPIDVWLRKGL